MAQEAELAGHVLAGKYRLIRSVAPGPREVHEARHESFSGRVAVKLWPMTTPWDAFRRGAERAMTLRHPGVMQVLDFNCEPGRAPFLVLEWVDGRRLSEILAEAGLLPLERVAPLIESAAWALASAHQQGIVHQELRPDEVFVVQAPGTTREWVKLAGFGVSAALAGAGAAPPSRYRAPEQRGGRGTAHADVDTSGEVTGVDGDDPQSDQYALAAIAYEMLAGVPPFDHPDDQAETEPPPISDLAPGVSPAVDTAIRQALSREPEQRFAGVLEFARALRAAAEGASSKAVRELRRDGGARKETVSPFFNPLQSAGEALRRVAHGTARLRTLGSARRMTLAARGVLAGGLLVLAFAGVAVMMRPRAASPGDHATRPPVAAAPVAPSPPVAPLATPSAPAVPPAAVPEPSEPAAPEEPTTSRAAAWAKLAASTPARATGRAAQREATPRLKVAAHPVAAASAAAGGACVMSVGSRPPADVWIDDRSLGKRTPVASYRLPCGDHKLVLKRADLDIYQMEIVTLRAGAAFKKVYPLQ
jgi:eukaryotic-like serine/threonine-protein kinase